MSAPPPGAARERPRRFRPRFHWELLACGISGHELIGTDAAELRPEDAPIAREGAGEERWHRCVRCDSWIPLPPPEVPAREFPPAREEVRLPERGRALRDKIVLRAIAIDRAFHVLLLTSLAALIFLFEANQRRLQGPVYKVIADLQGGGVTEQGHAKHGLLREVDHVFSLSSGTLKLVGAAVSVYAVVQLLEAIGLWMMKRWAEYLAFVATTALLPLEVYELTHRLTPLKVLTFAINIAVVVYLLLAKRLFGLRGGAAADRAERDADVGWGALEAAGPNPSPGSA